MSLFNNDLISSIPHDFKKVVWNKFALRFYDKIIIII